MTVGIGAICESETDDPKVVISSDRLVTTVQMSRIEHEHPETKLITFGDYLGDTHLVGVIAGGLQFGDLLQQEISSRIKLFVQDNGQEPWVSTAADLAARSYRSVVQARVENMALSSYGLKLEDLSRQHQFQDEFLMDVLAEVEEVRETVQQNLTLLLGGVGPQGPGLFQIARGDLFPQNDMGYATIGSGTQPSESEFIKSEYGKTNQLSEALATIAAAHHAAEKASGVGGDPDMMVVDSNDTYQVDEGVMDELMDRQETIADAQQTKKEEILSNRPVGWEP